MFDWLEQWAAWLTYTVLHIGRGTKLGDALTFFIYDTLKILILLGLITMLMGFINSYFPVNKIRNYLATHQLYGFEYLLAAIFGAITPFCSCSSVPLFMGFVRGGIPLGVTFAFLITSPLVNEVAIALFIGMFGLKTTLLYAGSGILLGVIGGWVLGQLRVERYLTPWAQSMMAKQQQTQADESTALPFGERWRQILIDAWGIIKGVFIYIVIGIGIGALMHGFIPTGFFEAYISKDNPLAVPLAVLVGVPMYSNAAGVLPIIQVLVQKGIPLGTAIAFMMAVVGLSIPEAMLLKKVMTTRLIGIFFATVTFFIILSGYLFNFIL